MHGVCVCGYTVCCVGSVEHRVVVVSDDGMWLHVVGCR